MLLGHLLLKQLNPVHPVSARYDQHLRQTCSRLSVLTLACESLTLPLRFVLSKAATSVSCCLFFFGICFETAPKPVGRPKAAASKSVPLLSIAQM